jgi:hypothetical protein
VAVAPLKLFRTARISITPLKEYSYGNGILIHDLHTDLAQPFWARGSFLMQAASSQATPPDNLNLRPMTSSCAAKCSPPCILASQLLSRIASISDTSSPLGGGSGAEPYPPCVDHPQSSRRCNGGSGNQSLPLHSRRCHAGDFDAVKIGATTRSAI